ncbi:ATP-dependent zinc protease family protein [Coralliovum pocilloporae]|uniref:ATP-dependent zinc protease family protein n=1 Tax=Coralliovum pocilloporae TaxID=3066369 RepID=UPI003306ECCC
MAKKSSRVPKQEIGWREWIALPDLGLPELKAKIDTGARTSAVHASGMRAFVQDGKDYVEFSIRLPGKNRKQTVVSPLLDQREIKNTSGVPAKRFVIETTLIMGARRWPIELSLADRANMGFELILGRTAIRRRGLLVNPGRSFLLGLPGMVDLEKSA